MKKEFDEDQSSWIVERFLLLLHVLQVVVLNLLFLGSLYPNRPYSMEFGLHRFGRAWKNDRNRRQQRPMFCHRFHHRPNSDVRNKKRRIGEDKKMRKKSFLYFEDKGFVKNRI